MLRNALEAIGVPDAQSYRTHDFRRGHAEDLRLSGWDSCNGSLAAWFAFRSAGAPLWEILEAGQWSSPAFLKYLDLHSLERDVVVQAHMADSDEEG